MVANRSLVVAALTFLVVGALTAYAALQAEAVREFRHRAEVAAVTSQVAQSLRRQFVVYEQLAHALQALFRASMTVEEDEFSAFVRQIVAGRPEIIACAWVPTRPKGTNEGEPVSDGNARGQHGTGYWVFLRPGTWPGGETGADSLAKLLRARDAAPGQVGSLTALLCRYGTRAAICFCGPAQSRGGVLVQSQRGQIGVFVDLEESLGRVLDAAPSQTVEIRLELGRVVAEAGHASGGSEWHVIPLTVMDTPARLHVAARFRATATSSERLWLWGFGIACSLLASAYAYLIASQHDRTRKLVEQRTRELQKANRQLQGEIEQRLQTEEALRRARQRAEQAAATKGEFISRVSHEIRTSVQTIASVVELLRRSERSETLQGHIRLLESAAQALLDLVDNVLNYARIETGRLDARPSVIPLREQLTDWVRLFAVRARERGLELLFDLDAAVPAVAEVDATLLRQVVVNLVSNAVKYTERGYVQVRVRGISDRGRIEGIEVTVEDSGPGVSQEQRDEMFKPFVRLPRKQGRQEPGTGLGLAIVQRSVQTLGGSIAVEPVLPHGTRFTVRVPCRQLACSVHAVMPPWRSKVDRVLLSCQSDRWRELLERWFERWGCATATDWNEQSDFQVAVVEFSDEASGNGYWGKWLPVSGKPTVVLTHGLSTPLSSAEQRTQVSWLTKPLAPDELSAAIGRLVWPGARERQEGRGDKEPRPLRVLLVEDTHVNRVLLEGVLRGEGYRVRAVGCLSDACDLLGREPFDVVLLDIELPDGNGFELARKLRAREQNGPCRRTAVIAISGHTGVEHQRRCAEAGVDVCLCKPVNPEAVAAAIRRVLRSGATAERAEAGRDSEWTWTDIRLKHVDLNAASRTVGGDWSLYKRVLAACAQEVPELVEAVEGAIKKGHPDELRSALHTLRGALRTVGATGMLEDLRIAEGLAARGNLDALAALWGRVRPKVVEFLTNDVRVLQSLTEEEWNRLGSRDKTLRAFFRPV